MPCRQSKLSLLLPIYPIFREAKRPNKTCANAAPVGSSTQSRGCCDHSTSLRLPEEGQNCFCCPVIELWAPLGISTHRGYPRLYTPLGSGAPKPCNSQRVHGAPLAPIGWHLVSSAAQVVTGLQKTCVRDGSALVCSGTGDRHGSDPPL